MNVKYESLVNQETGKALNNCNVLWSSESDIGGDVTLYSNNVAVCVIHLNSLAIIFSNIWNRNSATIEQVKTFICNYTGREGALATERINKWIKDGLSDLNNFYDESYDVRLYKI